MAQFNSIAPSIRIGFSVHTGVCAPTWETRGRRRQRRSPCMLGLDRGGKEMAKRKRSPDHRQNNCGARERHVCTGGVANGQETRSLPRDRTDRPRTVARRGRIGPSPPAPQSRRSADRPEGHSYTSQGQMAQMVDRKSVIQSEVSQPLQQNLPTRSSARTARTKQNSPIILPA
jgi:hypothetical protein